MPQYDVMGNHDLRGLTSEQWMELSGREKSYYHIDQDGLRTIILNGNDNQEDDAIYQVTDQQFEWLEKILADSIGLKKIVFIHYPIVSKNIQPGDKMIVPESGAKLKKLFAEFGVLAVFSGHIEKLELNEEDGVRYFVIPGLERSKNKSVAWYDSFAEINVRNQARVTFYYKKDRSQKTYQKLEIPSEEFEKIVK